jgi:hypothetical protein
VDGPQIVHDFRNIRPDGKRLEHFSLRLFKQSFRIQRDAQTMVGFCHPHFVGKAARDRLLVGIGRDVVILVLAIGQLRRLTPGELLQRGEWFFVFTPLAFNLHSRLAASRLPEPIEKFPPVGRKESDIRVNRERSREESHMLPVAGYKILDRRFLIAGIEDGAGVHIGLRR